LLGFVFGVINGKAKMTKCTVNVNSLYYVDAAKLVISQIHLDASGPSGSNMPILEQFAEANDITQG